MRPRTAFLAFLLLASCDGEVDEDGGMDGGGDAATDASRRDALAPMCTPTCGVGDTCCDVSGEASCLDLRNDPEHCGRCEVNCISEHRGDGCSASSCTCGSALLGCSGMSEDFCCPAPGPGLLPYCTSIDTSPGNCGGCGRVCDSRRGDRCDGGQCRCGALRGQCDGTPESVCCQVGVDIACVDTTTDTFNCGMCDNLCQSRETCQDSTCTTDAACPGGCALGEICCDGACCTRRSCLAGAGSCSIRMDGGPSDAGSADAGPG